MRSTASLIIVYGIKFVARDSSSMKSGSVNVSMSKLIRILTNCCLIMWKTCEERTPSFSLDRSLTYCCAMGRRSLRSVNRAKPDGCFPLLMQAACTLKGFSLKFPRVLIFRLTRLRWCASAHDKVKGNKTLIKRLATKKARGLGDVSAMRRRSLKTRGNQRGWAFSHRHRYAQGASLSLRGATRCTKVCRALCSSR